MHSILIVEDNLTELGALKNMIYECLPNELIDTASSFVEAARLISERTYSMYFLDIQLSNISNENGIALGKLIRSNPHTRLAPIIFTTTVTSAIKIALNELHCYNFLEKPFFKNDIEKVLHEILDSGICINAPLTYKDINNILVQIHADDVVYVYVRGHITEFHCINQIYEVSRVSLDKILLDTNNLFIKIHRSHLINPKYLSSIDPVNNYVHVDNHTLPIGVRFKKNLFERIKS